MKINTHALLSKAILPFAITAGTATLSNIATAYNCTNTGADAFCASTEIPAGLSLAETPQLITLTIDDALHAPAYNYTDEFLAFGHKNPNGAAIPSVYFISTEYTDYHLVQQRYAQGSEIAVHTMSHTTSTIASFDDWNAEIQGARKALSQYAQVPIDEITGFRAPFLQHSDSSFKVLSQGGFSYDSSVTENLAGLSDSTNGYIWPYTYDNLHAQSYDVGTAPAQPYEGLWEIPMYSFYENGAPAATMDYPGGYDALLAMFKAGYNQRAATNKAPLGLYFHSAWFNNEAHVNALNDFLTWALAQEGTWVVTNQQLIAWMKNPHRIDQMLDFDGISVKSFELGAEIADGFDNDQDGSVDEDTVNSCTYGGFNFRTNEVCPAEYPTQNNVVLHNISVDISGGQLVTTDDCTAPAWDASITYDKPDEVTYQDRTYAAKWYSKNDLPTSAWSPWDDQGACKYTQMEYFGRVSPNSDLSVLDGESKTINVVANAGYTIQSVTIDGQPAAIQSSYHFNDVTSDHSFAVVFAVDDGAITYQVSANVNGQGSIAPSGVLTVAEYADQTFTITPDQGYFVASVLVDGIDQGGVSTLTLSNVTANTNVVVNVEKTPLPKYNLTVTQSANGTISPLSSIVEEGESTTYTITPMSGYKIDDVSVNGVSQGAISTLTLTNITADQTITASFSEQLLAQFTVSASATAGGSVSVNSQLVDEGTDLVINITPDAEFEITEILLNNVAQSINNQVTLTNITADQNLAVTFSAIDTSSGCVGVTSWNANESWTNYSVGDQRVDNNQLWEVTNIAYSSYQPSGAWGHFGWSLVSACN